MPYHLAMTPYLFKPHYYSRGFYVCQALLKIKSNKKVERLIVVIKRAYILTVYSSLTKSVYLFIDARHSGTPTSDIIAHIIIAPPQPNISETKAIPYIEIAAPI